MRLRRNKDEIECDRCHCLTESVNCHPVTKRGSYCFDCYLTLKAAAALPARVDIRRGDHEPVYDHQVERDRLTSARTALCTDPTCDIKLPGHSHKV